MSFSSRVKEELAGQLSSARHCQIAELAAILSLCGRIRIDEEDHYSIKITSENENVAKKYFTLLKNAFNIRDDVFVRHNKWKETGTCSVTVREDGEARRILQAVRLLNDAGEIEENLSPAGNLLLQRTCCKRAFLRGAFMAAGSISDPEKFYHFEISCASEARAGQLRDLINFFDMDGKIILRKSHYVVYVKEGDQIADLLKVMEAPVSLMEFENIRILKDKRNSVNRQVNCETANIHKTVSAAVKQIEDIRYIRDHMGLEALPEALYDMAVLRLEQPEATLKELGEALDPPVGKSGVNHRLRKLGQIAEDLKV